MQKRQKNNWGTNLKIEICFLSNLNLRQVWQISISLQFPPTIIKYRDYKKFESKVFNNNLQVSFKYFDMNNSSFIELKTIFMELLNKVAPLKTKYLRGTYSKFMTKELSKAIILRTKLQNKFLKKGH